MIDVGINSVDDAADKRGTYVEFLSGEKNLTGNLIPLNPTFSYFFIVLFIFFNWKFNYLIIFVLPFFSLNLCDSIIYRLPSSWWRGLCRLQRGRFKDHTGERGRRRREIYLLLFIWYNNTCITTLYFHSSAIVRDIKLFLFYFHPWLIQFRKCFCFFFLFPPKVPGGVGPMTIAMLMRNTVNGCRRAAAAAAAKSA